MSRFIPHPLLSAALVLVWLLLNSFSLGHLVLGTIIALIGGWAMGAIEPARLRIRKPFKIIALFGIVFVDIIRSNIAVARLILSRDRGGARVSGFVRVPLKIRDPAPLAVLAMILTATPGTAWLEFDAESGVLLLHVFDYRDEEDWVHLVGTRYETLLLEVFG